MPHSVSSSSALGVGAVGCKTKTSQHHAQGMQMTLEAVPVQAVLLQRPRHLGLVLFCRGQRGAMNLPCP